jgi:sulfate/thiosulfate transport system substrate-binding protein
VVDRRGTRKVAEEYLKYLYTDEGQRIAAKHYYRPRNTKIPTKLAKIKKLYTIDKDFGGWQKAQKTHFADGGTFDQIYAPTK